MYSHEKLEPAAGKTAAPVSTDVPTKTSYVLDENNAYYLPRSICMRRNNSYSFPVDSWQNGLQIKASIGGGPSERFMVDTGSTGVVVGHRYIGNDAQKTDYKFCFGYSSSGYRYEGIWVRATVLLQADSHMDAAPNHAAVTATTTSMMIRMAQRSRKNKDSPWDYDPKVRMLGVGFDRDEYPDPNVQRDTNPFLLLKEMSSGTMTPGYILTTTNIELGITTENVKGFEIVQLDRDAKKDDWVAPMVKLSVPTVDAEFQAILLVDTGLKYCIVQAPSSVDPPQDGSTTKVDDGQRIQIATLIPQMVVYDFVVGDTETGVAPAYVSWRHHLHKGVPFINTSQHALSQVDYLYDAKAGHLGFRAARS